MSKINTKSNNRIPQASIVRFVPFSSSIDASFWLKVSECKLHQMQLKEGPFDIFASYTRTPLHNNKSSHDAQSEMWTHIPPRIRLDQESLPTDIKLTDMTASTANKLKNTNSNNLIENEVIHCPGTFYVFNTLEAFKRINKNELLEHHANSMRDAIFSCNSLDPLYSILIISFLDLKKHQVVYWCAFPALSPRPGKSLNYEPLSSILSSVLDVNMNTSIRSGIHGYSLNKIISPTRHDELASAFHNMRLQLIEQKQPLSPYFCIQHLFSNCDETNHQPIQCVPLATYINSKIFDLNQKEDPLCFAFLDPSNQSKDPGWPLKNLVACISLNPSFKQYYVDKTVLILSFRPDVLRRLNTTNHGATSLPTTNESTSSKYNTPSLNHTSVLFAIKIPPPSHYDWNTPSNTILEITESPDKKSIPDYSQIKLQAVGWEKNTKAKLAPRLISLSSLLSPSHLASTAVNLNLSLMKWRQIPNLNTELLSQTRCLLLGAGTLGCNVARTLLGWGVTNIVFVDNGRVTYSNPARQSLFTIDDVRKEKAIVAADSLKRIVPGVKSKGVNLSIPMPGHDGSNKTNDDESSDYEILKNLIDDCDVIFLLTDTRESRWLPTLMAKQMNKILINAALGLDTYLVMRHGMNSKLNSISNEGLSNILGCYFCNDVVAPENSTRERTLDQQCTVTRPGLAPIAAALAVEMMVALLHEDKEANGLYQNNAMNKGSSSSLGFIPHQIRGSLSSHTMMTPTVPSFNHCTACSDSIVDSYEKMGEDLVNKVCCSLNSADNGVELLETLTGLKDFRTRAETVVVDWDDHDSDEDIDDF